MRANKGKKIVGRVVSRGMNKTAVVLVERKVKHSTYGKYVNHSSRFHAHDENNVTKLGDVVTIVSCRPISKNKHWMVLTSAENE